MWVNHEYLTDARNTRGRLERYFGLYELKIAGEHIVPEQWRPHKVPRHCEFGYIVMPLVIFVGGALFASIYVVASVLYWGVGMIPVLLDE
jgi:hypothetical protein